MFQCDPARALRALFDAMWAGPRYLLVFGGACPPVTSLVARALPALHLLQVSSPVHRLNLFTCSHVHMFTCSPGPCPLVFQVSFGAPPPNLSNRKLYGNHFSTVPSDRVLTMAAVKLLQRYRWRRVGVLIQEGPMNEVTGRRLGALT